MEESREKVVERLLKSFEVYYNITRFEEERQLPLVALCEFFQHDQKYMVSKKAELWATYNEEFLYLFNLSHLTQKEYQRCLDYAYEDGMRRMNIGPNHMCSSITVVILCDDYDKEAKAALKQCRISKSFHFSLHGWMDVRTVMIPTSEEKFYHNSVGRSNAKILKKILYHNKSKEKRRGLV
ncbi:MAG: hypothetical protein ACI4C1_05270 [Lachnospiraceae bacterium]